MTDTLLAEFDLLLFDNMASSPDQLYVLGHNDTLAWISLDPLPASAHPEADLVGSASRLTHLVVFPRTSRARWGAVVEAGDTLESIRPCPGKTAPSATMTAFFEALLTFRFWPDEASWLNALRIQQGLPAWPLPS